jgi:dGTPase
LAHDLGHTPFGHAGERTLHRLMGPHGGFEHNGQSLRIVDVLEERYPTFRGLNLTWEVREGIVKHSTRYDRPQVRSSIPMQRRASRPKSSISRTRSPTTRTTSTTGSSPACSTSTICAASPVARGGGGRGANRSGASEHVRWYQSIRRLIDELVSDLVSTLQERLQSDRIERIEDVRRVKPRLVEFSPSMTERNLELKAFLRDHLYTHHRVTRMTQKADRIMTALFELYLTEPKQLPPHVTRRVREEGESIPRVIADYVAGMTDRFALEEYKKLFDPYERV